MSDFTDFEKRLLWELVTGEDQGLSWGAAMSVAVESLFGMGYLTRGPKYEPTQKARDYIATVQKRPAQARDKPVAWRVKDFADGWILFHTEAAARKEAESAGNLVQPLYAPSFQTLSQGEPNSSEIPNSSNPPSQGEGEKT